VEIGPFRPRVGAAGILRRMANSGRGRTGNLFYYGDNPALQLAAKQRHDPLIIHVGERSEHYNKVHVAAGC